MKDKELVSDLHLHLDFNVTKEAIIEYLTKAESQKLKALSFIEHTKNGANLYVDNSPFIKMIKNNEIEKYFSGKIITGAEFTCEVDDKLSIYDQSIIHLLMYDFNPSEFCKLKWFNDNYLLKQNVLEAKELISKCQEYNLPCPKLENFDFSKGQCQQILLNYIMENDLSEMYKKVIGEFNSKSEFIRLLYNKENPLHVKNRTSPTIKEMFDLSKQLNAKLVIAHPFYMYPNFDGCHYMEYLVEYAKKTGGELFGIESKYMSNTYQEYCTTFEFAKRKNLFCTAGSDLQTIFTKNNPDGKMYFIPKDGQKIYYKPMPAKWICSEYEGKDECLTIDKITLDQFKDIRDYIKYHSNFKESTSFFHQQS